MVWYSVIDTLNFFIILKPRALLFLFCTGVIVTEWPRVDVSMCTEVDLSQWFLPASVPVCAWRAKDLRDRNQ